MPDKSDVERIRHIDFRLEIIPKIIFKPYIIWEGSLDDIFGNEWLNYWLSPRLNQDEK